MLDELKTLITRLDRHRELRFEPPLLVHVSPKKMPRYRTVYGARVSERGVLQFLNWEWQWKDLEGEDPAPESLLIVAALEKHLKGQEVSVSSPLNRKL